MDFPPFRNSIGMTFVKLPGGTFMMGDRKLRKPANEVTLSPFAIGAYEVTNAQYARFRPEHVRPEASRLDDGPVTGVTREDAEAFAAWLSKKEEKPYRLPTEAEWEYAARGGLEGKMFPWGDEIPEPFPARVAPSQTAVVVGSYPPNAYGLYDMAGNADEYVLDRLYDWPASFANLREPRQDPMLDDDKIYIARGGSFKSWGPFVFSQRPLAADPDRTLFSSVGFRLVVSPLHQSR